MVWLFIDATAGKTLSMRAVMELMARFFDGSIEKAAMPL